MAQVKYEYTPVVARNGTKVHALALGLKPCETACGLPFIGGWRVALRKLNCVDCKLRVGLPCAR